MTQIWVMKADGSRQHFERQKVIATCLKMRAGRDLAEHIADQVEEHIYDGIPTRRILQMIFAYLRRYQPVFRHRIDLRRAISLIRPQPDWEHYVQLLLHELGYTVTSNQILRGRCVEHEIDAVARRGDDTVLVEIKHHYKYHTLTDLDVCRVMRATFEDLTEGFDRGFNRINFNKTLIVCNTKFSHQAKQYAQCRRIDHIGWKAPNEHGLDQIIEEKKFHPITLIRNLDRTTQEKLGEQGILLLRQLRESNPSKLAKKTGIKTDRLEKLVHIATEILSDS